MLCMKTMLLNKKPSLRTSQLMTKLDGNYNGYNKLYKDLVDQDKGFLPNRSRPSGTVYYVTNY